MVGWCCPRADVPTQHNGRPWAAGRSESVLDQGSAVRRTTSRGSRSGARVEGTGSLAGMPACEGPATVVFDPSLTEYDFGPSHPMSPIRVDLTIRLARDLGVLERLGTVAAPMADDDLIATVHDAGLMEAVK